MEDVVREIADNMRGNLKEEDIEIAHHLSKAKKNNQQ